MATTVLTTCNNAIEANLIKGMLENHEISCFLTNENFSTLMPHYSDVLGAGVQVVIDESDLDKARELLMVHSGDISCPNCGSADIRYSLGNSWIKKVVAVVISLLIWVPFGNIRKTYYCFQCRTEFKR